jgi:hypothetical protein
MARKPTGNPVGAPVLAPGEKDGRAKNGGARTTRGGRKVGSVDTKPRVSPNPVVKVAEDFTPATPAAPAALASKNPVAEVMQSFPVKAGPAGLAAAMAPHVPKAINRLMELVDSKNEAVALEAAQEVLNRVAGLPVKVVATSTDLTPSKEPERLTFSAYRARLERSLPGMFKRPLNDADRDAIDRAMNKLQPGLQENGQWFLIDDRIEQE